MKTSIRYTFKGVIRKRRNLTKNKDTLTHRTHIKRMRVAIRNKQGHIVQDILR